jgi:16S rRNA (cytosine967-C5)-methyltransferase
MNILALKKRCIELLERIESEGAYVHLVLQEEAHRKGNAPEEYPILVQLVRGVLEQRRVLVDALTPLLSKSMDSLPIYVQYVLCLGAYQLLFLDRVKKRDVVFEAVELVKHGRYRGFAGLVNAVLRRLDRVETNGELSDPTRNFPEWLLERWAAQFGSAEVSAFCASSQERLPLYFRVNTTKVDRDSLQIRLRKEGVVSEPSPWSSASLKVIDLPERVRVHELQSFRDGCFFIQDLSSTVVADLVCLGAPRRVWDVCAAPGGKACSIAMNIAPQSGVVWASDRAPHRVELIRETVKRLGLSNVEPVLFDAVSDRGPGEARYDAVLVDAPCSGYGTVGRKIDVLWSRSVRDIEELIALQERLLAQAASAVDVGGVLVYSTCTIETDENEGVVKALLEAYGDFELVDLRKHLEPNLCTSDGMYRAWPHRHAMAGAFAACMRRRAR